MMRDEQLTLPPELAANQPGTYRNVAPATLRHVALIYVVHANRRTGGDARPGIKKTIAPVAGCSPRWAKFAIRALEHLGVLRMTHVARRGRAATYRVLPGSVGSAEEETPQERAARKLEAVRVKALRLAYVDALQTRHGTTDYQDCVSVRVWRKYARVVADLADATCQQFDVAARRVWRAYMEEDGMSDGKLRDLCHPPGWLSTYLPGIVEQLTIKTTIAENERALAALASAEPPRQDQDEVNRTGSRMLADFALCSPP
jgi:hypothetical protein